MTDNPLQNSELALQGEPEELPRNAAVLMNDRIPQVSIGLPVYQGEKFIAETIDSLLNQTYQDTELIICDNASTDGTEKICRSYAASDSRVRYYRNDKNLGPFKNYSRVFELARAPYFKWNSANDVCAPILVERCMQALAEHPDSVLAYMKTKISDDDGTVLEEFEDRMEIQDDRPSDRFIRFMANFRLANALSGVMRSDALRKVRPFGEYRASDIVFMAELAMVGKFIEIPEYGFYRRVGESTSTTHREGKELWKFYFPSGKKSSKLVLWKLNVEYLQAVLRADISVREKLRLVFFVLRAFHWNRQALQHELMLYTGLLGPEKPADSPAASSGPAVLTDTEDRKQPIKRGHE